MKPKCKGKSTNRICSLCPKTFMTRQTLHRHVKNSHSHEASSISHPPHSNMKCGLCISENSSSSFNSIYELCDHVTKIHQLDAPVQTIEFSDKIDHSFVYIFNDTYNDDRPNRAELYKNYTE
uniref:C2H2-type domain-containing protein n=1 Tax=Romanomermis culicivorax TaxID=13658 RepID=A0A915K1A6_ROMCU